MSGQLIAVAGRQSLPFDAFCAQAREEAATLGLQIGDYLGRKDDAVGAFLPPGMCCHVFSTVEAPK